MTIGTDLDIAWNAVLEPIEDIARRSGLDEDAIEPSGRYKAKIRLDALSEKTLDGRLILVSAMTPTPFGEGKTTVTVGLGQALSALKKVPSSPFTTPLWDLASASKGAPPVEVIHRCSPRTISISISRENCTLSQRLTTFFQPWWTMRCTIVRVPFSVPAG